MRSGTTSCRAATGNIRVSTAKTSCHSRNSTTPVWLITLLYTSVSKTLTPELASPAKFAGVTSQSAANARSAARKGRTSALRTTSVLSPGSPQTTYAKSASDRLRSASRALRSITFLTSAGLANLLNLASRIIATRSETLIASARASRATAQSDDNVGTSSDSVLALPATMAATSIRSLSETPSAAESHVLVSWASLPPSARVHESTLPVNSGLSG